MKTREIDERVRTSRLLGSNPDLVLHGGGNTSVKIESRMWIKASGADLASLGKDGLTELDLGPVRGLLARASLSDAEMVRELTLAQASPSARRPSVESLLHALVPAAFVDHTHADSVVALTQCQALADPTTRRTVFGSQIEWVPYLMPGFELAQWINQASRNWDWTRLEGFVLSHHGLVTFGATADESYRRMLSVVARAEAWIRGKTPWETLPALTPVPGAELETWVSQAAGKQLRATLDRSEWAVAISRDAQVRDMSRQGPLTPDHVLYGKPFPWRVDPARPRESLSDFATEYSAYFKKNAAGTHSMRDPAPRWAIWPGVGLAGFGETQERSSIALDIARHACRAFQAIAGLGGRTPLKEKEIFDVEYWDLELSKASG